MVAAPVAAHLASVTTVASPPVVACCGLCYHSGYSLAASPAAASPVASASMAAVPVASLY